MSGGNGGGRRSGSAAGSGASHRDTGDANSPARNASGSNGGASSEAAQRMKMLKAQYGDASAN